MFENFNNYRNKLGPTPVTPFERQAIIEPLLNDPVITKMVGLKMLGDNNPDNDLLGYIIAGAAFKGR